MGLGGGLPQGLPYVAMVINPSLYFSVSLDPFLCLLASVQVGAWGGPGLVACFAGACILVWGLGVRPRGTPRRRA